MASVPAATSSHRSSGERTLPGNRQAMPTIAIGSGRFAPGRPAAPRQPRGPATGPQVAGQPAGWGSRRRPHRQLQSGHRREPVAELHRQNRVETQVAERLVRGSRVGPSWPSTTAASARTMSRTPAPGRPDPASRRRTASACGSAAVAASVVHRGGFRDVLDQGPGRARCTTAQTAPSPCWPPSAASRRDRAPVGGPASQLRGHRGQPAAAQLFSAWAPSMPPPDQPPHATDVAVRPWSAAAGPGRPGRRWPPRTLPDRRCPTRRRRRRRARTRRGPHPPTARADAVLLPPWPRPGPRIRPGRGREASSSSPSGVEHRCHRPDIGQQPRHQRSDPPHHTPPRSAGCRQPPRRPPARRRLPRPGRGGWSAPRGRPPLRPPTGPHDRRWPRSRP